MNALHDTVPPQHDPEVASMLMADFRRQREAYLRAPTPDYQQRRKDLLSLKKMLSENREEIIAVINKDYGNRSRHETLFAEVISVTDGINDALKHLRKWMKVQRRHIDSTMFPGGRNRVVPQAAA